MTSSPTPAASRVFAGLVPLAYLAVALPLALVSVSETGPLWPDSPRYANAGAMVHDWLGGERLVSPMAFAQANYAQYPAFSIPYHPPGYPLVLGIWFKLVGLSYLSARVFSALCWALAAWLFDRLNRHLGVSPVAALASGLLLLTTPQLVVWSRDTMSEIPSLVPLFAAALFWVRWLNEGRRSDALLAAVLTEVAFFFRVTSAGIIPGVILYGLVQGQLDRRRCLWVGLYGLLYLGVNVAWVKFAQRYASHEVAAAGLGFSPGQALDYFLHCGPGFLTSGTAALALLGLGLGWRGPRGAWLFWGMWVASFALFKAAIGTTEEVRHFLTAVPGFAGLAATLFLGSLRWRLVCGGLTLLAIGVNLLELQRESTRGVVGYAAVAETLATQDRPGHLLLSVWEDQELIFRFRSATSRPRYCVRGDRTLAVRVSEYAHQPDVFLAQGEDDVLNVIRKGRIGYIVTCTHTEGPDPRPADMVLVDRVVQSRPDLFRPLARLPVIVDYFGLVFRERTGTVTIWEYLPGAEDGPPQLDIIIPTAGMRLKPELNTRE